MNLFDAFRYDRWANRRWIDALDATGTEAEWAVMRHLLAVQQIWLMRVQGDSPAGLPEITDLPETLEVLYEGWTESVANHRHNPTVAYHRFDGEPQENSFESLALHTLNHGTYHRGEIRGLYRARSCPDFVDTDLILFLREAAAP